MFTTFTGQSTSLTRPLRPKYTVHEEKKKLIMFIILQKKKKTKKDKGKEKNRTKHHQIKCQSLTVLSMGFRGVGLKGEWGEGGGLLAQYLHM